MIICGDCLEVMRGMDANSVDAIVTDPPYALTAVSRNGSPRQNNPETPHGRTRLGGGFMGKTWDASIPGVDVWAEALRVAKPGCHLLAFGGTRTFHRLTCAIEDAGWEIRDCLGWIYGSGFPKSHNLNGEHEGWGTALKPAWEPIILARKPLDGTVATNVQKWGTGAVNVDGCRIGFIGEADERESKAKNQHADFGSGPVKRAIYQDHDAPRSNYQAQGRWPANIIHDGSDEVMELFPNLGRCGITIRHNKGHSEKGMIPFGRGSKSGEMRQDIDFGDSGSAARFFYCAHPDINTLLFSRAKTIMDSWKNELANTVDDDSYLPNELAASVLSDAVIVASRGAKRLSDAMELSTSVTPSELRRISESLITAILCSEKKPSPDQSPAAPFPNGCLVSYAEIQGQIDTTEITISHWKSDGSVASVTFKIMPANSAHGAKGSANRFIYCAKASRREREAGLEGMPEKQVDLTRLDPEAIGCNNPHNRGGRTAANHHPTVKPVALMCYLCRLVTPPNGLILDPFCGSGTTGIAAKAEGFRFIGIDNNAEYCEIAERRIGNPLPLE